MVYRVLTRKLRIQRGPGRPDKVVERPGHDGVLGYVFDDSDGCPTLVEFDALDKVDVSFLLACGAIREWEK